MTGDGRPLPERLSREIERERDQALNPCEATKGKRHDLLRLKGIGPAFAAIFARMHAFAGEEPGDDASIVKFAKGLANQWLLFQKRDIYCLEWRIFGHGLFANGGRADNIARARELLAVPQPHEQDADDNTDGSDEPDAPSHPCPCCGGHMIIIETFERGSTPRNWPPPEGIDRS